MRASTARRLSRRCNRCDARRECVLFPLAKAARMAIDCQTACVNGPINAGPLINDDDDGGGEGEGGDNTSPSASVNIDKLVNLTVVNVTTVVGVLIAMKNKPMKRVMGNEGGMVMVDCFIR